MSISGLCQICETREATNQCDSCGSLVCDRDYERGVGICVQCAGDGDVDGGVREPDDVDGAGDVNRI